MWVDQSGDFLQPASVVVVSGPVFVNTGRMFLTGVDCLYDAVGGCVGYRWNGHYGLALILPRRRLPGG